MPRRRPHRDTRPSWDAPFLPCIRNYHMGDGSTRIEVDPVYESRYRAHLLEVTPQPTYAFDPTYHLRRKPPR